MLTLPLIFWGAVILTVYLFPALVAVSRRHVNAMSIFLTSLYLGWTVIGWIAALIWAFSNVSGMQQTAVVSGAPVLAASAGKISKKHIGMIVGGVVLFFILVLALLPDPAGTGTGAGAPQVKAGEPVPVESIFGE